MRPLKENTILRCAKGQGLLSLLIGLLPLLGSCGGEAGGNEAGGTIVLQNANNYLATGSLAIPTVETAPGADLDICWTNVATDLQCHPVVPTADLDNVGFLRFLHLNEDQVQVKLTSGELKQVDIDGYVEFHTDHDSTCTKLSNFSFFGTVIDVAAQYQENLDETYMLMFAHGIKAGVGARVMTFVKPTAASTNTRVEAPSGCGMLTFAADLTSPARVSVPTGGPWHMDWKNVTRDSQGNEVIYALLDTLLIGYYEGLTVADLQAKFFDIEILATSLWDLPLTGARTANLALARNRKTGAPFDGFAHGTGTWIMALSCASCQNPAPVVLVVLEPKDGK